MRFNIPQFIEHEAKIVGPLTFKQFGFIGGMGIILFFLYFLLPSSFFMIFTVVLIILTGSLAFIKINGKSLPLVLSDMIKFGFESKRYIWKKKEQPMIVFKEKEVPLFIDKEKDDKKEVALKIGGKSRLKKINTNIEIRTK